MLKLKRSLKRVKGGFETELQMLQKGLHQEGIYVGDLWHSNDYPRTPTGIQEPHKNLDSFIYLKPL